MAAIVDFYQDKVLAALALDAVRPAISYQDISVVVPILEALTSLEWMQVKQFIVTRQPINIPNFIPRPSRSLRLFVIFFRYFTTMARNTVCALKRPPKPHEASLKMYTVALRLAELQLLGHMQTLSDIFGAPAPLLPINLLVNGVLKNIKLKTYVQEWNPLRSDNCFTTDGVYEYFREVNNGFYGAIRFASPIVCFILEWFGACGVTHFAGKNSYEAVPLEILSLLI